VRRDLHKEYKITLQTVGQGSYARVFRAYPRGDRSKFSSLPVRATPHQLHESSKSSRPVVVKMLHKREEQAKWLRQCDQLTFEIAALVATRGHPNVAALRGVFIDQERPHLDADATGSRFALVMEWHSCGDLSKTVALNEAPLDEHRAVDISRDVLAGLVYVHSFEIIHRDVKPENIFLAADGGAVLGDFGLACSVSDHDEASKLIGSPGCCAPETVMCERYDTKADVFGMGCVVYFMLSGCFPFFGRSIHSTLLKTVQCKLVFDDEYFRVVSSGCKDFIASLLEKFPTNRPTSSEAYEQNCRLAQREAEQRPDVEPMAMESDRGEPASSDEETNKARRWRNPRRPSVAPEDLESTARDSTNPRTSAVNHVAHGPVDHELGVLDVSRAYQSSNSGAACNDKTGGGDQCAGGFGAMISKLSTDAWMCNVSTDTPVSSRRGSEPGGGHTMESGRHGSLVDTSPTSLPVASQAMPLGIRAPASLLPMPPAISRRASGPPPWLQRRRAVGTDLAAQPPQCGRGFPVTAD